MVTAPAAGTAPPRLTRRAWDRPGWPQRHPQALWLLLMAPALAYLGVFFIYPVFRIMLRSVLDPEFTLGHYTRLVANPGYLKILWITVRISLVVAAVALLLGYPLAFHLSRLRRGVAQGLLALVLLPFWTSVLVRSYAWIVILGSDGLVNRALTGLGLVADPLPLVYNELGVVIGMVHILLPYMVLSLYAVMREIDPTYLRAASSLGAGVRATFLRVYLPLSMPGITSGFLLVFILSIGFFITPALLGGGNVEMIALQIDTQVNELVDWGFGSTLATVLFLAVIGLMAGVLRVFDVEAMGPGRRAAARRAEEPAERDPPADPPRPDPTRGGARFEPLPVPPVRTGFTRPRRRYAWWALGLFTTAVLTFLVAPIVIIVAMSFSTTSYLSFPPEGFTLRWYAHYLGDEGWMAATSLSVRVAAATTVGATVLGTLAAIGLVRTTVARKPLLYFAILAPLIVPVIVSAVALYFLFVRLRLVGSFAGFVLAHTVLAIPVVVLVVSGALRRVDLSLERAATILGAHPARAFVEVTLPAIRPAIGAALLFAFITSFDEIVLALFLAGTTSSTLPRTMWESLLFQIDPTIAAISTLLVGLSLLTLVGAALLRRGDPT